MKRLLLPLLAAFALPTAVNAFPFGNDVEIENTVGEKILIKGKTISTKNLYKKDLIKLMEQNIKESVDTYSKIMADQSEKNYLREVENCKSFRKSYLCSKSMIEYYEKQLEKHKSNLVSNKELIKDLNNNKNNIIQSKSNPDLIHIVSIDFTPVYIDLNNQKRVGAAERIYCLNEALGKEKINYPQTWVDQSSDSEKKLFKNGLLLYKVCKKYAKF